MNRKFETFKTVFNRTLKKIASWIRSSFLVLWAIFTLLLVYLVLTIRPIRDFDTVRNACPNQLIEARSELSIWGKTTDLRFYCK